MLFVIGFLLGLILGFILACKAINKNIGNTLKNGYITHNGNVYQVSKLQKNINSV